MDPEDIRSLSISSLKALLFSNHVNVNATMVLEKSDLVERVLQLVENEKAVRERARRANEEEEEMLRDQMRETERDSMQQEAEGEHAERHEHEEHDEGGDDEGIADHNKEEREGASSPYLRTGSSSSPPLRPASVAGRSPPRKNSYTDRNGLCVVCQDDEANIAIVDCGYVPFSFVLWTFWFKRQLLDISPCVGDAPTSLWHLLANVRFVERGLSQRRVFCVYSRHRFVGLLFLEVDAMMCFQTVYIFLKISESVFIQKERILYHISLPSPRRCASNGAPFPFFLS